MDESKAMRFYNLDEIGLGTSKTRFEPAMNAHETFIYVTFMYCRTYITLLGRKLHSR